MAFLGREAPPHDRRMTLAEHLEELRVRVVRSVAALGVALVVTIAWQDAIMKAIVWPHEQAMEGARRDRKVRVVDADGGTIEGRLQPGTVRIVVGAGADVRVVEGVQVSEEGKLKALYYPETLFLFFKVSLIAALALASPVILYQLWMFVSAGLYPHERRLVYVYAPVSIGLFLAGAVFGYFVLIPISLRFLAEFGRDMVEPMFQLGPYVNLLLMLTLVLGLVFELPLVMHFAARLGVVSAATFAGHRRLAVVLIVVAAAVITPTSDPYTLFLVAAPMYVLFEAGIVACRMTAAGTKAAPPSPA